uniref:Uncharacterized protein n=1 Tax=Arundo donax TaxID=35708 RepID=A0A0A9FLY9_ARUDO
MPPRARGCPRRPEAAATTSPRSASPAFTARSAAPT